MLREALDLTCEVTSYYFMGIRLITALSHWYPGANNWLSFSCQHYVLIVDSKGVNCGDDLNTARYLTSNTYLDLDLLCGNTYTLSVRAVTNNGSSADKETFISIPSQIGAVRNLAVKFIPGNNATRNNATDFIKQRMDGFWLTWEPPANVKTSRCQGR